MVTNVTKLTDRKIDKEKDNRRLFFEKSSVVKSLDLIHKPKSSKRTRIKLALFWSKDANSDLILECNLRLKIYMRVRSWLRMNAGGVPNTCKSNEATFYNPFGVTNCRLSGGRVSNAWATCPIPGDSSWKRLIIPHKRTERHLLVWKTPVVYDGLASD